VSRRRVAVVQARTGSTRLPGKVLLDLAGGPMLDRVVRRALRSSRVDALVVATTDEPGDDAIEERAAALGVPCFRGSEDDVLDRTYRAAREHDAGVVVRITSDCPLVEPEIVDRVVAAFEADPAADFASNTLDRTYPQGLDVEVASLEALERAWEEAVEPYERAHVFPYIYEHPGRFRLVSVRDDVDRSSLRWTVDTEEDLAFARAVYDRLGGDAFGWRDVLALLEREPALADLNRAIAQKPLHAG
jgi:spore coat polysaccharide biosynthesis protein SpsF